MSLKKEVRGISPCLDLSCVSQLALETTSECCADPQ